MKSILIVFLAPSHPIFLRLEKSIEKRAHLVYHSSSRAEHQDREVLVLRSRCQHKEMSHRKMEARWGRARLAIIYYASPLKTASPGATEVSQC